jgi:hypothetical protein
MDTNQFDWKAALEQLSTATVNQQTLEEAAELMVTVSSNDPDYHEECLLVLNSAIASAEAGDESIIPCINGSGYQVADIHSALELLRDFRSVYLVEFNRGKTCHVCCLDA